jgi:hypothetical protein
MATDKELLQQQGNTCRNNSEGQVKTGSIIECQRRIRRRSAYNGIDIGAKPCQMKTRVDRRYST